MSADRFEIHDHGSKLTVRDTKYGSEVSMLRVRSYSRELTVMAGAIRQQARDIAELEVFAEIGRQWNADSSLAKWFPLTAERVEQDAQEIAKLRTDLAAAVSENAALLAANRDLKAHFDALKGDHDEAAHFGRHFIRDDPNITPRGAIIRLGDKCTDLFCRLQSAEQDRDTLRARLAAIYGAPAIARIESLPGPRGGAYLYIMGVESPPNVSSGTDLIARPAKD